MKGICWHMGKKDLRIYAMLEILRKSPVLSMKELAERFDVSEMTFWIPEPLPGNCPVIFRRVFR